MSPTLLKVEAGVQDERVKKREDGSRYIKWSRNTGIARILGDPEKWRPEWLLDPKGLVWYLLIDNPIFGQLYPKMARDTTNMVFSTIAGFVVPYGADILSNRVADVETENVAMGHVAAMAFSLAGLVYAAQTLIPMSIPELEYAYENKASWIVGNITLGGGLDVPE